MFSFPLDIGVVVIRKKMLGSVYEFIIFLFIYIIRYIFYYYLF